MRRCTRTIAPDSARPFVAALKIHQRSWFCVNGPLVANCATDCKLRLMVWFASHVVERKRTIAATQPLKTEIIPGELRPLRFPPAAALSRGGRGNAWSLTQSRKG